MHRRYFADGYRHLVLVKPGPLPAGNGFVAHLDYRWEKKVTFGPTAGLEDFGWHTSSPERHRLARVDSAISRLGYRKLRFRFIQVNGKEPPARSERGPSRPAAASQSE